MFESKRFWIITSSILFLLNIALVLVVMVRPTFFSKPTLPAPEQPADPFLNLARRLNLSDIQKQHLRERVQYDDRQINQQNLMINRHRLMKLAQNESVNTRLRDSLINEIAQQQIQLETMTFDRIHQLYRISNPEQRERFNRFSSLMSKRIERRQGQFSPRERPHYRQAPKENKKKPD